MNCKQHFGLLLSASVSAVVCASGGGDKYGWWTGYHQNPGHHWSVNSALRILSAMLIVQWAHWAHQLSMLLLLLHCLTQVLLIFLHCFTLTLIFSCHYDCELSVQLPGWLSSLVAREKAIWPGYLFWLFSSLSFLFPLPLLLLYRSLINWPLSFSFFQWVRFQSVQRVKPF